MIRRVLTLVAGLSGAVGASQAPELMQQYDQRLGGAVQELSAVIEDFNADAAREGLTLDMALARYKASSDSFLQRRGVSMERAFNRHSRISAHERALAEASAFKRPALLWQYRDRALFKGALKDYRPAVPATIEGAIYAFIGFVLGSGIVGLLLGGFGRLVQLLRRRPVDADGPSV